MVCDAFKHFRQKTFIVYADGELIFKLKCSNLFSKKPNLICMANKIIELPLASQSYQFSEKLVGKDPKH